MDLGARLAGRHVLITGASSGLGAHFARLCARHGARVSVAARRRDRLATLVGELEDAGAAGAAALDLDVTDAHSVADCFGALSAPLDVLVNNAGVSGPGAAIDLPLDTFDAVMATNLRGPWLMATHAARAWRDGGRGGTIVTIASIVAERVAGGVHGRPHVVGHEARDLAELVGRELPRPAVEQVEPRDRLVVRRVAQERPPRRAQRLAPARAALAARCARRATRLRRAARADARLRRACLVRSIYRALVSPCAGRVRECRRIS